MKTTMLRMVGLCLLAATCGLKAQDPAPYTTNSNANAGAGVTVIQNLLKNESFEYGEIAIGRPPNDWGFILESGREVNGGITEIAARTGTRCVGLGTPFLSLDKWQVLVLNVPVEKGAKYEFSAWVKAYPDAPLFGGARGVIQIEWKDGSGNEIDRIHGQSWNQKDLASGEWIPVKVTGQAPVNTVTASFVITYHLNPNQKSGGSFLVDDVVAVQIAK
jgi:hypothetical protein